MGQLAQSVAVQVLFCLYVCFSFLCFLVKRLYLLILVISILTDFKINLIWQVGKSVAMVFKAKPQILLWFAVEQRSVETPLCPEYCPQQQVVRILRFFRVLSPDECPRSPPARAAALLLFSTSADHFRRSLWNANAVSQSFITRPTFCNSHKHVISVCHRVF